MTTPNITDILNSALRRVGSSRLETGDTSSHLYTTVFEAYNDAVLEIFSENIFNYNTKKAALTATNSTSPTTDTQFEYNYSLPADFNVLKYLTNKENTLLIKDYTFYDNQIHTNEKEMCMYYSYIPDLSSSASGLPAFLNRLLALHIAQSIAIEISGDNNRHEILYIQYTAALKRARVMDARQGGAQTYIGDNNSRIIEAHQAYGSV